MTKLICMPRINKDISKHFKNWPEVDEKMKPKKLGVSFGYSQFIIIILSIYLTIYQPILYLTISFYISSFICITIYTH